MITKLIYSATIALAIFATASVAPAQDKEKRDGDKPQKAEEREKLDRPAPERGVRKGEDRDPARRSGPGREQDKGNRPRDSRGENLLENDRPRNETGSEEMRTFLGVATSSVHPALREHLALDDGFGIQIEQVLEDSPAGKAGMKKSDILTMLDDQRLIGPEHLSLLVRSMEPGDKVTLTFIRKGKEQTADLELGEKAESDFGPIGRGPAPRNPWHESMERNQDYWRGWMEQNRRGPDQPEVEARFKQPRMPEGRPPAVSVRPGFPVQIFGASGIMKIDNDEGELTITEEDGEHHIVIKNKDGETVHEGEFDPAAGVGSLPEEAREQLKVMKLDDLEVLTPPKEEKEPEKTSVPNQPQPGGQPL